MTKKKRSSRPRTIRALRESTGLHQAEFARRIGVQRQAVWAWENGHTRVTLRKAMRISEVFGFGLGTIGAASEASCRR